ncbi:hypothetical protein [Mesorhizobium sp. B4-1-4]|uniref:hypothetical protein n=1 Tax=Mesorhizobium sp. B4-1-4 TaxID=2589888 RepID=UPI001D00E60E|nr:hypothetical protein [Mesorhizobium sp. B4-1-4]UCI31928.1 hypothetical protein FJW03_00090 [Mesorhizobium sp. B4-1-4]
MNAVAHGVIESKMYQLNSDTNSWYRTVMLDATPIHRQRALGDVAAPGAFRASDDASYIPRRRRSWSVKGARSQ